MRPQRGWWCPRKMSRGSQRGWIHQAKSRAEQVSAALVATPGLLLALGRRGAVCLLSSLLGMWENQCQESARSLGGGNAFVNSHKSINSEAGILSSVMQLHSLDEFPVPGIFLSLLQGELSALVGDGEGMMTWSGSRVAELPCEQCYLAELDLLSQGSPGTVCSVAFIGSLASAAVGN